jgi:hypothetical protein
VTKPFVIEPHFRLPEWVAEEKDYFREAGLEYVFHELIQSTDGKHHDRGDKVGAFQSFEHGRQAAVSCACHWTVDMAAAGGKGRLYTEAYSVAPAGIFVASDSPIRSPEQLAGVPISVGYQSGSHYATIQGLEQYLRRDQINLSFAEGMLFARLDRLLDGTSTASTLFSGPYYLAEQLGYRKVLDVTFMITTMVTGDPDPENLRKYFSALRRAQKDIDLRPDRYTHYYRNEFPTRYHASMDTRRWGPGERVVFEAYTQEMYEATVNWIAERGIFPETSLGARPFAGLAVAEDP